MKSPLHSALAAWTNQQRAKLGLGAASTTVALTAEASHRQFYRQSANDGSTVIIMDSPPTLERNQAFVDLAALFHGAGLPVPQLLAADMNAGYLLLSDVGARDLYSAYEQGQQDAALAAASAWLHRLQPIRSPLIPLYTPQRLHDELEIFSQWFAQGALQLPDPTAALADNFTALVQRADAQRKVCVHRDYHCRNLLFERNGEFGIVDFQDALHGPLTYDLASLLHDCYYTLNDATVAHWREQFRLQAAPHIAPAAFAQDCDWMALQRQLKAIGIFVRLAQRDQKGSHLRHVAPTLIQASAIAARYSTLDPLRRWLEQHGATWPDAQLRLQQQLDAVRPPQ
ncbi:MAG: aminoglycoside phosphotransferase family protein [Pseudomonadales bacterium]